VLYELYFLPPQFYFVSKLVPVVWEKTEMVHPSNFPSKTNVQPRHPTGVDVHARHLSPWHTSALTWLPFFYYYFNDFLYIYKSGVAATPFWPRGGSRYHFLYLFKLHKAHHEIYKTTGVYMRKKNLCLSNKHLVIF
jgi:hypothetical protein